MVIVVARLYLKLGTSSECGLPRRRYLVAVLR
jgi:hypothetical protein